MVKQLRAFYWLFFIFLAIYNQGFSDMQRLKNQVVIITGASKGIGREVARVFSREGAKLLLVARDGTQLKELSEELPESAYIVADIRYQDEINKAAALALNKWGRIDVLIANAGVCLESRLDEMTLEQWKETIDIDLTGVFLSIKSVLPTMKSQKKGKIVITSSVTGPVVAMPGFAHYGAAKSGISGLVRTAGIELAKYQININSIEPGNIISEGMLALGEEHIQQHVRAIPWGRLGKAEEVAFLALFLASNESDYITGQGIIIDGGQTLPESHYLPF